MPASTRRSAQKRQTDTRPRSDPDLPDSSPSRPAAKRKRVNATAPRRQRRPKTPEVDPDEESDVADDSGSEVEGQTLADRLTPYLAIAKAPVTVAVKYHNSQSEGGGVKAFARISGQNWTYYVQELAIVVGRPPDAVSRHSSSLGAESSPIARNDAEEIHIDLGPSKTVSRSHALIFFDRDDSQWYVEVKGRNGLRINDRDLRRGQKSVLGCGDVLEIAGTQMVFIAAGEKINIHPTFLERMAMFDEEESVRTSNGLHAHPDTMHVTNSSSSQTRPPTAQTVLAPAPPNFVRPTTPVHSPKRAQQSSNSATKNSSGYAGSYSAYRMETTEQIDYSSDAMKDLKPSIPYGVMITQAILSKPDETITLDGIYKWITANFAYYRFLKTNWQNSIRHNLSLNAAFEKIPRGPNEPGKGMKWHIVKEKRNELIAAVAKHMKKSNARHSSAPNSPSTVRDDFAANPYAPSVPAPPYSSVSNTESNAPIKTSPPPGRSPPLTAYPTAQESYTPSRGSRMSALPNNDHSHGLPIGLPALSDDPSPLPIRRHIHIRPGVPDSSPVLTSSLYDGSMVTPAPRKHNLNIPIPSTLKLPTSHMPDSSPAPFWKFPPWGSTPARLPEISPLKGGHLQLQSSSPPPGATNGNGGMESPTRGRGMKSGGMMGSSQDVDDDEELAIDLKKGFNSISQYHRQLSAATASHAA